MAQNLDLSVVSITNPTSDDFTWKYNGEPYTVKAGETAGYAKPVAYHLAKHLSTKMVSDEALKGVAKKDMDNPNAQIHVKVSQLHTYDTHERRIALYKILGNVDMVIQVISKYPFKGFIGDMDIYQKYVEKSQPEVVAE